MTVRTRQQIREAAKLIFRPFPWSYPFPWWYRWTFMLVGPFEAWRLAGEFVDADTSWGRPHRRKTRKGARHETL